MRHWIAKRAATACHEIDGQGCDQGVFGASDNQSPRSGAVKVRGGRHLDDWLREGISDNGCCPAVRPGGHDGIVEVVRPKYRCSERTGVRHESRLSAGFARFRPTVRIQSLGTTHT